MRDRNFRKSMALFTSIASAAKPEDCVFDSGNCADGRIQAQEHVRTQRGAALRDDQRLRALAAARHRRLRAEPRAVASSLRGARTRRGAARLDHALERRRHHRPRREQGDGSRRREVSRADRRSHALAAHAPRPVGQVRRRRHRAARRRPFPRTRLSPPRLLRRSALQLVDSPLRALRLARAIGRPWLRDLRAARPFADERSRSRRDRQVARRAAEARGRLRLLRQPRAAGARGLPPRRARSAGAGGGAGRRQRRGAVRAVAAADVERDPEPAPRRPGWGGAALAHDVRRAARAGRAPDPADRHRDAPEHGHSRRCRPADRGRAALHPRARVRGHPREPRAAALPDGAARARDALQEAHRSHAAAGDPPRAAEPRQGAADRHRAGSVGDRGADRLQSGLSERGLQGERRTRSERVPPSLRPFDRRRDADSG